MKGGVNIWVALRDTMTPHRAWMHISTPYTENDMPRSISDPHRAADAAGKAAPRAATRGSSGSSKASATVSFDLSADASSGKAPTPSNATRARKPKSAIALAIESEALAESNELGVAVL